MQHMNTLLRTAEIKFSKYLEANPLCFDKLQRCQSSAERRQLMRTFRSLGADNGGTQALLVGAEIDAIDRAMFPALKVTCSPSGQVESDVDGKNIEITVRIVGGRAPYIVQLWRDCQTESAYLELTTNTSRPGTLTFRLKKDFKIFGYYHVRVADAQGDLGLSEHFAIVLQDDSLLEDSMPPWARWYLEFYRLPCNGSPPIIHIGDEAHQRNNCVLHFPELFLTLLTPDFWPTPDLDEMHNRTAIYGKDLIDRCPLIWDFGNLAELKELIESKTILARAETESDLETLPEEFQAALPSAERDPKTGKIIPKGKGKIFDLNDSDAPDHFVPLCIRVDPIIDADSGAEPIPDGLGGPIPADTPLHSSAPTPTSGPTNPSPTSGPANPPQGANGRNSHNPRTSRQRRHRHRDPGNVPPNDGGGRAHTRHQKPRHGPQTDAPNKHHHRKPKPGHDHKKFDPPGDTPTPSGPSVEKPVPSAPVTGDMIQPVQPTTTVQKIAKILPPKFLRAVALDTLVIWGTSFALETLSNTYRLWTDEDYKVAQFQRDTWEAAKTGGYNAALGGVLLIGQQLVSQVSVGAGAAFGPIVAGVIITVQACLIIQRWRENKDATKRDLFQDLAVTAATQGSAIGGGIAGAAIGSSLGSMVLPGVGTVVGGAIGGVVGAFLSSHLAQLICDKTIQYFSTSDPTIQIRQACLFLGIHPDSADIPQVAQQRFKLLSTYIHPDKCGTEHATQASKFFDALTKRKDFLRNVEKSTWQQLKQSRIRTLQIGYK